MAKILMVDDEESLRLMMGRQLRRAGHEVSLAEDGIMALEVLQGEEFDLILSDMRMPRLDGMGLLAKAKEVAPDTEFIIMTGHGSMENAVEAFKTGNVFDYLLKPLNDIFELNAVVERAVERRRLKAENGRLVAELSVRVDELEVARRRLTELSERDGLTGLYNHRTIHARLEEAMAAAPGDPLSVILMDLDGFKQLNDTYGHLTGDKALKRLSETLREACPESALLGRYGGDEFLIVLPGQKDVEATAVAEAICESLHSNPFEVPNGSLLPLRASIGIAESTTVGESLMCLLTAADSALYEGKHGGGDTITLHMVEGKAEGDPSRTSFDILDSLVTAIDNKDRYTRHHSEDVTGYALQLVGELNCSDDVFATVRAAGLLHDIGKIGIPASILRKPGKLTDEEYEIMKSHVTVSTLIIHGLPHLRDIIEAVANHHERWDGKGYPQGLRGEEIPLLGRVMAIADAFSAMTLDRPYRAGLSVEEALSRIEQGAGAQFDPSLAPIFIKSVRENGIPHLQKMLKAA